MEEPRAWVICRKADGDVVVRVNPSVDNIASRRSVKVIRSGARTPNDVERVLYKVNQRLEGIVSVALLTP